jgi:hypothetical protein
MDGIAPRGAGSFHARRAPAQQPELAADAQLGRSQPPMSAPGDVGDGGHDEHPRERTHEEIMPIIFALMLAMLLAALDQTIVATALPPDRH